MTETNQYSLGRYLSSIVHYISPYRRKFFTGAFLRLTSDLVWLYPAWALSQIVLILSSPITVSSTRELVAILVILAAISVYYGIFHNFSKYFGYQVAEKAGLDIYKDCLFHVFRLDYSWQETENSGNKMKRIDKGSDGIDRTVRRVFDVLIEVVVNTVGVVAIFFTINEFLGFGLIFYIVTYFIVGTYLLKKAIVQERIVNKGWEDLGGITYEALNNIQTIKALGIDQGVGSVIHAMGESLFQKIRRRIKLFQFQSGALLMYEVVFQFIFIAAIVWGIINGHYNVSLLVLFTGLFSKVSDSARQLTDVTQALALARIWISRAMSILDTPISIEQPEKVAGQ